MKSLKRKSVGLIALASVIATYGLIVLGAIVRTSGSGLGCPDWPLCYGRFVPPPIVSAWIEFSHRVAVSLIAVLVVATGPAVPFGGRRLLPLSSTVSRSSWVPSTSGRSSTPG